MSLYHKFDKNDILHSVIYSRPKILLASGTIGSDLSVVGWRSNIGVSSSLSLYEGTRSRLDVKSSDFVSSGLSVFPLDQIDTHSIDKIIFVSGSYPASGSIQFVKVRSRTAGSADDITDVDWYEEHFNPIEGLYNYYSQFNSNYFTGSYDYYSIYLKQNASFSATCILYSGSELATLSNAFSLEAQIKPTQLTSSIQDFTILSQRDRFKLYISGSDGRLVFSDYGSFVTSSAPLTIGAWQHVSCVIGNSTASLYVDAQKVAHVVYTGSLSSYTGKQFTVGAEHVTVGPNISPDMGFSGLIFETKVWDVERSASAITNTFNTTLYASSSINLVHYSRFNDGPFGSAHGYVIGSGAYDYSRTSIHGNVLNVNSTSPLWQPNDNNIFKTKKKRINNSINMMKVLHIPSMFYGSQIATGSVRMVCNAYNNKGLTRVLNDDGRGGLYVSGSITSNVDAYATEHAGSKWNKIGNVFYAEGLVVITDPSLLDFGELGRDWNQLGDALQVQFEGVSRINTKIFMCRLHPAEANASNNPTFTYMQDPDDENTTSDKLLLKQDNPTTYITSIGIYNEERKLVAVAKLATPIRKREKDKINIRLKMDF